ncbi:hypothetical protein [Chitinophaga sedimenti]|uniref:hypothetical protein n=1 Tax=Chitinophaga sedimenti TaxID=2033606 RepID=UPI00249DE19A|nr:hypothetical protein [Chitinophaga sedimenti]
MNRIASVTLLKDAASTALYGAKAANGVVVVATKEPEPGAVRISYSGDFSVSAPMLGVYNMMNAAEKLEFEKLAGRYTAGSQGVYTQITRDSIYNARLSAVESGVNTYWLSEPVRTGITQGHSIYADGGDGSMRYSAGVNYKTIGGVMKGSKRDTWGGNLKLSYRNKKLNIMENLFVNGAEGSESPYGSFATFVNANPYFKKRLADGSISRYLDETTDPNATDAEISTNPLYNAGLGNRSNNKSLGVQNNLSLIYDIYPGLRFRARCR